MAPPIDSVEFQVTLRLAMATRAELLALQEAGHRPAKAAQIAIEGALGAALSLYRSACLEMGQEPDCGRLLQTLTDLSREPIRHFDGETGAPMPLN